MVKLPRWTSWIPWVLVVPRSTLVFFSIRRATGVKAFDHRLWSIHWQPLVWVLFKVLLAVVGARWLWSWTEPLAVALQEGFAFFRLEEIYSFQMPDGAFFRRIARLLVGAVLGYYGVFYLALQVQGLFSALVIHRPSGDAWYLQSMVLWRRIHSFPAAGGTTVTVQQTLPGRLLDMGTVQVYRGGEEVVTVRAIGAVARAAQLLQGRR